MSLASETEIYKRMLSGAGTGGGRSSSGGRVPDPETELANDATRGASDADGKGNGFRGNGSSGGGGGRKDEKTAVEIAAEASAAPASAYASLSMMAAACTLLYLGYIYCMNSMTQTTSSGFGDPNLLVETGTHDASDTVILPSSRRA